jgi:hypothetical protein
VNYNYNDEAAKQRRRQNGSRATSEERAVVKSIDILQEGAASTFRVEK